ncbi:MAG TPA: Spy/CpxP family protein refolding chaperone, partial [Pyrinomonadaceae bacterium]
LKKLAPRKSLAAAAFGLALALHAFCAAAWAQAQAPPPARRGGGAAERRARDAGLVRRLNLTPEQRARLVEIRMQGEPETRELARRVRLARRALDEAIYADASDESLVEQRAGELAAAQAALVRLRAAAELKVRRVLTPEQLQTFRELRRQAARRQLLRRRARGARIQPPPPEDPE